MTAVPELRPPEDVVADALRPADPPDPRDTDSPWQVEDRASADWCVSKIRQAHIRYGEATEPTVAAIEALRAEADRLQAWVDAQREDRDRDVAFFEGKLCAWLMRLRSEDDKVKSVKLSGGTVKSLAGRPSLAVDDDDALAAWARAELPDAVTTKVAVDRRAVLKAATRDGLAPDGARVEVGETTYRVVVEGES